MRVGMNQSEQIYHHYWKNNQENLTCESAHHTNSIKEETSDGRGSERCE